MENRQNPTPAQTPTPIKKESVKSVEPEVLLSAQQLEFIDYKAVGGFLTDSDGMVPKKMTMVEFARRINVNRDTLYEWQKKIPDFWELVRARRKVIGTQERLNKVHDVWYLSALKPGNDGFKDRQLFLANFDDSFRMPAQKHEHDVGGGLADLLQAVRKRQQMNKAKERRNVIDADPGPTT